MLFRRQRFAGLGFALLLAIQQFVAVPLARADGPTCSPEDIWDAGKALYEEYLGQCATLHTNAYYYPVLIAVGVAWQKDEGKEFCSAVLDLEKQLKQTQEQFSNVTGTAQNIFGKLPQGLQDKFKNSDLYKDLDEAYSGTSSTLSDFITAFNIVACACKFFGSKALKELVNEVGSCVNAALCEVGFLWGCECGDVPAPIQVDCADLNFDNSAGNIIPGNAVPNPGGDNQCGGGFCCYGCGSYYGCVAPTVCYCPEPMVLKSAGPGTFWGGVLWEDYFQYCDCPAGTHKAGTGALARACLCNGTDVPVNADGTCPAPPPKCETPTCSIPGQVAYQPDKMSCDYTCGCPAGLVQAGNTCVTPCTDSTQILLASGTCCAPSQATSCGTCCPIGMKPDASGNCVSPNAQKFTPVKQGPTLLQKLQKKL
jgi:hypothetical protein